MRKKKVVLDYTGVNDDEFKTPVIFFSTDVHVFSFKT